MQMLLIYIIIYRIKLLYIFLSLSIAKSNYPVHTLCDTSKLPLLPVVKRACTCDDIRAVYQ